MDSALLIIALAADFHEAVPERTGPANVAVVEAEAAANADADAVEETKTAVTEVAAAWSCCSLV